MKDPGLVTYEWLEKNKNRSWNEKEKNRAIEYYNIKKEIRRSKKTSKQWKRNFLFSKKILKSKGLI